MKIKQDFITNSSSTSFIFIFRGGKIDLYQCLLKYKEYFNLSYKDYKDEMLSIQVWDVIRSLDSVIREYSDELWLKVPIEKIETVIKNTTEELHEIKLQKSDDGYGFYENYIRSLNKKIDVFKRCKNKNLCSFIEVGFGDNHGNICGDTVGITMDCEGKKIQIDEDDLIIFTEPNR